KAGECRRTRTDARRGHSPAPANRGGSALRRRRGSNRVRRRRWPQCRTGFCHRADCRHRRPAGVKSVPFAPLDPALYREIVRRALAEDLGWGDVTTEATIRPEQRARGILLVKSRCVIAGIHVAAEAFRQLDPAISFDIKHQDGAQCAAGDVIAEVRGSAASMLTAERTALNLLQRMSGIATMTRAFVDAAGGAITVLDTRKTTPTLRALEKYSVRAGAGTNHRAGLDDGVLIKDNHVRLAGGVREAVTRMKAADPEMPIEVEAQSLDQVDAAIA